MKEYITHSPEETILLGEEIGKKLRGGDIIAFEGGLGWGLVMRYTPLPLRL